MDEVHISPYSARWAQWFTEEAALLRTVLGDQALRIDHIGSTSIPGLSAKPVLDIQVSFASIEPVTAYLGDLEQLGYRWIRENPEKTKRFFLKISDAGRVHLHGRNIGTWHQQFPLLFRDYLRQHPDACSIYASEKRRLAAAYQNNRLAYMEAKNQIFWHIQYLADRWASETGWETGPSDA